MPRPSVYIETSILSYLTARPTNDLVAAAHQAQTVRWWETRRRAFALHVSELVLQEARAGDPEAAQRRLAVTAGIPVLRVTDAASALAARLLTQARLPARATADALHIAMAAVTGWITF
jgi:hypothetical protein